MTRNKSGYYENIEDTKGLSRSRKSEDSQYNGQKKKNETIEWKEKEYKKPTMIYKRYHLKPGVISCVPES